MNVIPRFASLIYLDLKTSFLIDGYCLVQWVIPLEFGDLKKVSFSKGRSKFGKIAVAEYRFVTHDFVAKFHLNGMVYNYIGFLHADVIMTEKETTVKNEVVSRFIEHFTSE
jgi:hypothetical protein